jgi:lipopolysaccharide/colanic/teichoic acid biosynthesis glycosyltransferase
VDRYEWLYRKRLSIKPGVTCLWQISGRNEVTFKQWMEMDQYYIDNWSLWLDMVILARTAWLTAAELAGHLRRRPAAAHTAAPRALVPVSSSIPGRGVQQ